MITRASDSSPARLNSLLRNSPDFEGGNLPMADCESKIDSPSTRSEPASCAHAHAAVNATSSNASETSSLTRHPVSGRLRNGSTSCDCSAIVNSNFKDNFLYLASAPAFNRSIHSSVFNSALAALNNATCKVGALVCSSIRLLPPFWFSICQTFRKQSKFTIKPVKFRFVLPPEIFSLLHVFGFFLIVQSASPVES